MNYQKRIKKLQAILKKKKLDAILISRPENRTYLSGYSDGDQGIEESSGLLLIPKKGSVYLLTDFRFEQQAKNDVPWVEVTLYTRGIVKLLTKLLPDLSIRKLAFEGHYTLFSMAGKMKKELGAKKIDLVPMEGLVEAMRIIKDEKEIDTLRKSVRLNEEVFTTIYNSFTDYETELDVAMAIEQTMRRKGAARPSFETIVASGKNSAFPHAVPSNSPIEKGKSLTIDMGLVLDGYCSDMTRNFVPGKPGKKYLKLHRLVRKAQLAGISAIKAGARCCDVDKAARTVINKAGYGKNFGHSLGHGVGLAVHEEPRLSSRNRKKLKAGMIVTVEPGIYISGWGGIRLEEMVVVREEGCENLNKNTTWLDLIP